MALAPKAEPATDSQPMKLHETYSRVRWGEMEVHAGPRHQIAITQKSHRDRIVIGVRAPACRPCPRWPWNAAARRASPTRPRAARRPARRDGAKT